MPIIYEWFSTNSLTINVEKTNIILHGSQKTSIPGWETINFKYNEENIKIKTTTQCKYLGIIVDSHFRWDWHINWLCKKLRYLPYVFKKLKHVIQEKILATSLYHALFFSILRYGILIWGGANKTIIKEIETIQKRVLKVIYNKPLTYSSELLFKETKQLNIKETFGLKAITTVCSEGPINLNDQLPLKTTRQTEMYLIKLPIRKKTIGQRNFEYTGIKLINNMPTELRKKILFNHQDSEKKRKTKEIIQWLKTINIEEVLKIEQ